MDTDPALPPLLVTLELETSAWESFEALRRAHFPAGRNLIPAHVTLFHKLPGREEPAIREELRRVAEARPGFSLEVHDVMRLGRGVAFRLRSDRLAAVHAELWAPWIEWLTPQDRQPFRPHIVVQNKAEPPAARELYAKLIAGFRPYEIRAVGLHLWRYLGGPWESVALFPFPGTEP